MEKGTKSPGQKGSRIAAVGDIHVARTDEGKWTDFFKEVSEAADILLLCGDLTDTGHAEEAEVLAKELESCSIPVAAVLGNHDHESDQQEKIINILQSEHVHVLDGHSVIIGNIGIAGVKGFGGGFGQYMMPMWGEKMNKLFVQETVDEALKLERALVEIDSHHIENIKKIVIMHYSPVRDTVVGEPEEIFPFLGSSRFTEPMEARNVTAAFHGHAHIGALEGKTPQGVRVYNVSAHVLKDNGIRKGYFVLEI